MNTEGPVVHIPDAELVSRSQLGDREAFVLLFRRYLPTVYDFVGRLVLEGHDAAAVTHDTFVQAQRQLPSLRDPGGFRTWLFGSAYVRAARRLRSEGLRAEAVAEAAAALTDETDRALWTTVAGFEPSTRAALDLHVRHGFEVGQIATVIGVDPDHAPEFLARVRHEMIAALPELDDPFGAYAELGEVEPPAGLEDRIASTLAGGTEGGTRPNGLRRAATALAILAITGVVAGYAAPRLAPQPAQPDAAGSVELGGAVEGRSDDAAEPAGAERPADLDARVDDEPAPAAGDSGSARTDGSATDVTGNTTSSTGDAEPGGSTGDTFTSEDDVYAEEEHQPEGSPPRVTDPDAPGAPTVEITSPEDGYTVTAQDRGGGNWAAEVVAVAEADDPDGQRLEGRWYSNQQDGDLSRVGHATFWLELPDGCPGEPLVHTVTVEVTDPDGHVARDSIDILVHCP